MLSFFARIIARCKGVTREDFEGEAGDKYRAGVRKISDYCKANGLDPDTLVKRASSALEGAANEKQAHAIKEFREGEKTKTEEELLRRTMESKVAKEEAETLMAQIKAADAYADLVKKLNDLKVAGIMVDPNTFHIGALPQGMTIREIENEESDTEKIIRERNRFLKSIYIPQDVELDTDLMASKMDEALSRKFEEGDGDTPET